ncbi:LysE family transporter, partial [Nonomuraea fuscirosea]|uniref:LysE family translocator n=1 Tax=Nonomuraea fuscirosea TaxID=1291556 RepID=UPI0034368235
LRAVSEVTDRALERLRNLGPAEPLPQFIPAQTSHLAMGILLASVHVALGLLWSTALVAFARGLRGWLRKERARRLLDRVAGTVIAAFGIRLALGD